MDSMAKDVTEEIQRRKAATFALLQNWAGTLESKAKQGTAWRDRTGHAKQSLHSGVENQGNRLIFYLAHGVKYGRHLEEGTPPHIIRPKNKKALYWRGAKHPVKVVRHPGSRSYAIVGPTMAANEQRIMNTVKELWGGD